MSHWDGFRSELPHEDPQWATTDRGWHYNAEGLTDGHYLDYGRTHYRSPHEYCGERCTCERSQPGTVHAVRFVRIDQHRTGHHESRYFQNVAQARMWIERGVGSD